MPVKWGRGQAVGCRGDTGGAQRGSGRSGGLRSLGKGQGVWGTGSGPGPQEASEVERQRPERGGKQGSQAGREAQGSICRRGALTGDPYRVLPRGRGERGVAGSG